MDQSILVYFVIILVSYILTKRILRKFRNLPPSPFPKLPILGHLLLLKDPNSVHRTLTKLAQNHGPVINLYFGLRSVLLVSSPAATEDCLNHNDTIFANRPRLIAGKSLGYDYTTMIWAPYGPLWRNHRKIAATEILSPHRLHLLSNIRANEVKLLVQHLYNLAVRGHTIEIKPVLYELTNNIMMRMVAGKRCYNYGETMKESSEKMSFNMIVKELMELGPPSSLVDFFPVLKYLGTSAKEKRVNVISAKLDKFCQDLVDEKRMEMGENHGAGEDHFENKTMVDVLLQLHKSDPSYFTDEMIKGLIQVLLLGGTETSVSSMEWALSLLLNNPEILHKAQKEIDDHVGSDRLIEEADLAHLPYLHCIINETFRMYPATPLLPPHENSADCIVGGYHVPRGTMLTVNVWAMQNDPEVWDEPRKFKPERFESAKGEKIGYKFMPFGSGRRACPGENLAMRVVGLTLGSLLQCFDWERVGEELVDMQETVGVSMWKANPLKANCRPRSGMIQLVSSI